MLGCDWSLLAQLSAQTTRTKTPVPAIIFEYQW